MGISGSGGEEGRGMSATKISLGGFEHSLAIPAGTGGHRLVIVRHDRDRGDPDGESHRFTQVSGRHPALRARATRHPARAAGPDGRLLRSRAAMRSPGSRSRGRRAASPSAERRTAGGRLWCIRSATGTRPSARSRSSSPVHTNSRSKRRWRRRDGSRRNSVGGPIERVRKLFVPQRVA